jgi:hypothetical protein
MSLDGLSLMKLLPGDYSLSGVTMAGPGMEFLNKNLQILLFLYILPMTINWLYGTNYQIIFN